MNWQGTYYYKWKIEKIKELYERWNNIDETINNLKYIELERKSISSNFFNVYLFR